MLKRLSVGVVGVLTRCASGDEPERSAYESYVWLCICGLHPLESHMFQATCHARPCGVRDGMRKRIGPDVRILSVLNTITVRQAAVRGDTRPMQEGDVYVLAEDSPSD